jgi:signal transduction histidine kinase
VIEHPRTLDALVALNTARDALGALWELTHVPLRVVRADGTVWLELSEPNGPAAICQYVDAFELTRSECESLVQLTRTAPIEAAQPNAAQTHRCFTGAMYRRADVYLLGDLLGKVILGPFRPANALAADAVFSALDKRVDVAIADRQFSYMPALEPAVADRIVQSVRTTIEALAATAYESELSRVMQQLTHDGVTSEMARKNDALEQANARLIELDRVKVTFLGTMSHELKTPLTSILGYAEMLSENIGGELSAEQRQFVGVIYDRSNQLLQMISSLIELARLDQGRLRTQQAAVDIAALIREVVQTFLPIARKRELHLDASGIEALPLISGDVGYLRQVLYNLVDNAMKFTPSHGRIRVEAIKTTANLRDPSIDDGENVGLSVLAPPQEAIEIRVRDSGVGIAPAERERVFAAFYQVDASVTRAFSGAGLGLAIVKRILDGHGATVRIEDNPDGQGVALVVTLPVGHADDQAEQLFE